MAVIKQKETNSSSIEDTRYRQVMSEIDDIFKQGRKEAAQSDGISLQDCIKGIKAQLSEKE